MAEGNDGTAAAWRRPDGSIDQAALAALYAPLSERRLGPFVLRKIAPTHPGADLEIVAAALGAVLWGALLFLPLAQFAPLLGGCSFHQLTGWPCISCGTTRAVLALAAGDVLLALRLNPLLGGAMVALAAYAPLALVLWLARRPRWRIGMATRAGRWGMVVAATAAALAQWAFLALDGR